MVVGIDGCKAGWFAVSFNNIGWDIHTFETINQIWDVYHNADLILIDIPIGLIEAGGEERQCDTTARQHLGMPRRTSVFPVPCRQATRAGNYNKANAINAQITNRGIPPMTWGIMPKIREVDEFLLANPAAQNNIREIHPEICFWSLAGHHPMVHAKRTIQGHDERIAILQQHCPHALQILNRALLKYPRNQVSRDDILDALVAAITAMMVINNMQNNILVHTLPIYPVVDAQGLRMEMLYAL